MFCDVCGILWLACRERNAESDYDDGCCDGSMEALRKKLETWRVDSALDADDDDSVLLRNDLDYTVSRCSPRLD